MSDLQTLLTDTKIRAQTARPEEDATAPSKAEIRSESLRRRNALPPDIRTELSASISGRVLAQPAFLDARVMLGYLSFGSEVDTQRILRAAMEQGKTVVLPKVNRVTGNLDLFKIRDIDSEKHLLSGVWGIREPNPENCESCGVEDIELILVPGVAFDRKGGRIGYGKGYYDRLLNSFRAAGHRVRTIAAVFECQVWGSIPMASHDMPVDQVVTEAGAWP